MRIMVSGLALAVTAALAIGSGVAQAGERKDKKADVHVEAPHTKVDVDQSVRVKAPYTRVKVSKRRVRVRAPYVNLNISW